MRTVQPSIIVGSYVWDQDRLPRDEFQIRNAALHRVMDEHRWKAVLIYGDADQHSALAYFSNFIPRLRWAMGLIPRDGEPRLLASMSSRDVPEMKLMTWIPDVLSGWTWESSFDPWLARLSAPEPIDIGTVGFDLMRPVLMRSVEKSLGNRFRLHRADEAVAACRSARPRDMSLQREAARVIEAAAESFLHAWRDHKSVEGAALEGERTARLMAAQDVRTLVSFDNGRTLGPSRGAFERKSEVLAGYIAVKHMGFWAEVFVSEGASEDVRRRVSAALGAALQSAGPGASARKLYEEALAKLGPYHLHGVLSGSIGQRIGLTLNEGEGIKRDSDHVLMPGEVYALHVGAYDKASGGAFDSVTIHVTDKGVEWLHRWPPRP
jgi:Xaa-Pro aminopeptidase